MHTAVINPIEPNSSRAERTRAAILAAAEELFASRGFATTRLEDVADAVKMTRAALFYYFKDKQSLFDAVLAASVGHLAAQREQVPRADNETDDERSGTRWVSECGTRGATAD